MADPLTVLTIASTAFEFVGGMQQASAAEQQAQQQRAIYEMQAEQSRMIADRNAMILEDQAAYDAAQMEIQAGQEQAVAQRKMLEEKRRTAIATGRVEAVAGASGGGVADPTVLNIVGELAQEGDFAKKAAMYEGESAAALLKTQAALRLYEGQEGAKQERYQGYSNANMLEYQGQVASYEGNLAASQYRMKAFGSALKGGASLTAKYAPSYTYSGTYSTPATNYSGQNVGTYQKPY